MTVGFAKVSIKGEGDSVGWFFLVSTTLRLWIADQVRNELAPRSHPAAAGVASSYLAASYSVWRVHSALWFSAFTGMTVRDVGNEDSVCWRVLLPHSL